MSSEQHPAQIHPEELGTAEIGSTVEPFQPHPEHADAVNAALTAIHQLIDEKPDFADFLRLATSTEDVRQALQEYGIEISNEALWRHRGSLLKDGQPTWRG